MARTRRARRRRADSALIACARTGLRRPASGPPPQQAAAAQTADLTTADAAHRRAANCRHCHRLRRCAVSRRCHRAATSPPPSPPLTAPRTSGSCAPRRVLWVRPPRRRHVSHGNRHGACTATRTEAPPPDGERARRARRAAAFGVRSTTPNGTGSAPSPRLTLSPRLKLCNRLMLCTRFMLCTRLRPWPWTSRPT